MQDDTTEPNKEVIVLTSSSLHTPHEELFFAASVFLGAYYTVGLPPPTSVAATQPTIAIRLWAVAMFISGVSGIASGYWRVPLVRRFKLEIGALNLGTSVMLLYTISLFVYGGWRAFGAAVFFGAWAAANLIRALQLRKIIRRARQ